jgi:hypothetical protein
MNTYKTIYEVTEIEAIINFMKAEKTIMDITESNGISTISTNSINLLNAEQKINLKVGQIITINSVNYTILSINEANKTFDINATGLYYMSIDPVPVKVLGATKWKLAINYLFGSRIEINGILNRLTKDPTQKEIIFPMIWLFIGNMPETNPKDFIDFKTTLTFSFVGYSDRNYIADERLTNVIEPVLKPLLELFKATMTSTYFRYMLHFENYNYKFKDKIWYFYGDATKNVPVFDAPTDAIETTIDLNFIKQYN